MRNLGARDRLWRKDYAPWHLSGPAVGVPVHEVADPAECRAEYQGRSHRARHPPERHSFSPEMGPGGRDAPQKPAVYGKPAVPDGGYLRGVGPVVSPVEEQIIGPRAYYAAHDRPYYAVHHVVGHEGDILPLDLFPYEDAPHQDGDHVHEAVEAYRYRPEIYKYRMHVWLPYYARKRARCGRV